MPTSCPIVSHCVAGTTNIRPSTSLLMKNHGTSFYAATLVLDVPPSSLAGSYGGWQSKL